MGSSPALVNIFLPFFYTTSLPLKANVQLISICVIGPLFKFENRIRLFDFLPSLHS